MFGKEKGEGEGCFVGLGLGLGFIGCVYKVVGKKGIGEDYMVRVLIAQKWHDGNWWLGDATRKK